MGTVKWGLKLLSVHCPDAASFSSLPCYTCNTCSQSATYSLIKVRSTQNYPWSHTKPLTICRAILTFIFSPLRRTFSRLTNSSASFRDSSCNKKTSTVNVLLHSEHGKICYESAPTWCEENDCSRPFDSTNSLLTMHS